MSDTREEQPARDWFWHDLRSSRGSYTAKGSLSGGIGLLAGLGGGCRVLAMFSIIWKGLVGGLIEAHSLRCSTEPDFDFGAVVWESAMRMRVDSIVRRRRRRNVLLDAALGAISTM